MGRDDTRAWASQERASAKAQKDFGPEWYQRLTVAHENVKCAVIATMFTNDGLDAVLAAAEQVERAQQASAEAMRLITGPYNFIPRPLAMDDVRAAGEAIRDLAATAATALCLARTLAKKARAVRRVKLRPPAKRVTTAVERRDLGEKARFVLDVEPQQFITLMLSAWPDCPTAPSAWAYFAIGAGMSAPISGDTAMERRLGWIRLQAAWASALKRSRERIADRADV
jgi:hypothetical protein